jgi:hypothetical protein
MEIHQQSMIISSVQVTEGSIHDKVQVWNRGGLAGELTVAHGDGKKLAARLDESKPHLRVEPARNTHIMASIMIVRGTNYMDDRESVWIEPVTTFNDNGEPCMLLRVGSIQWHEDGQGERGLDYEVKFYPEREWTSDGKKPRIISKKCHV